MIDEEPINVLVKSGHNAGSSIWYLPSQGINYWHREDGPAFEAASGSKEWWDEDELHRTDGPAIEYADGRREWWIDGEEITKEVEEWLGKCNVDINTIPGKVLFKLIFA